MDFLRDWILQNMGYPILLPDGSARPALHSLIVSLLARASGIIPIPSFEVSGTGGTGIGIGIGTGTGTGIELEE
jgi:hypothetical protein